MKKKKWIVIVVAVIIVIAIIGSGGNKEGQKEGEITKVENSDTKQSDSSQTSSEAEDSGTENTDTASLEFKKGETAARDGIQITMTKVKESNGKQYNRPGKGKVFVICEFLVENKSDQDYTMSMLDYNAYADGFSLSESYYSDEEDYASLSGTIAPGKKLKGALSFEVEKKYKKLEIDFALGDLFGDEKVKFIHEK